MRRFSLLRKIETIVSERFGVDYCWVELVDQKSTLFVCVLSKRKYLFFFVWSYLIELTANIDVSVLSAIALWKPYGAAHPRQGSCKLWFDFGLFDKFRKISILTIFMMKFGWNETIRKKGGEKVKWV